MDPALSRARRLGLGLLALALPLAVSAPAALAQAAKIFVSSTGKDSNAGTLGAPMRTFQAAENAVAAGGEIVVLNTAGYSGFNITKSVAVTVPTGVTGFITVGGASSGITINAAATDVVILRGLTIEGGNDATNGIGIDAETVGTLRVDNCTVRSFRTGIYMNANGGKLEVTGGAVRDGGDGIGVIAGPSGNTAHGNVTGCKIDDMTFSGVYSYVGTSGASTAMTTVTNCVISHCQTRGVYAYNAGATVYVDGCILSGNAVAAAVTASGAVVSRVTNTLVNNTTATSGFTGTLQPQ